MAGATNANEAPDGVLHGCSVEVWERFNVRRPGVEAREQHSPTLLRGVRTSCCLTIGDVEWAKDVTAGE